MPRRCSDDDFSRLLSSDGNARSYYHLWKQESNSISKQPPLAKRMLNEQGKSNMLTDWHCSLPTGNPYQQSSWQLLPLPRRRIFKHSLKYRKFPLSLQAVLLCLTSKSDLILKFDWQCYLVRCVVKWVFGCEARRDSVAGRGWLGGGLYLSLKPTPPRHGWAGNVWLSQIVAVSLSALPSP